MLKVKFQSSTEETAPSLWGLDCEQKISAVQARKAADFGKSEDSAQVAIAGTWTGLASI